MLVLYYGVAVVLQARDVAARGRVRAKVGVDVPACVACLCSVVEDHHLELRRREASGGLKRRGKVSGGLRRRGERRGEAWWWASSRVLGIKEAGHRAGSDGERHRVGSEGEERHRGGSEEEERHRAVVEDHHVELGGQPAPVARHVCVVWGGDSRHAACVCVVYLSFFDLGWGLFGGATGRRGSADTLPTPGSRQKRALLGLRCCPAWATQQVELLRLWTRTL